MERERIITPMDEGKAYGIWKDILHAYEGTLSEDDTWGSKGYKFNGKTSHGARFEITLHFVSNRASVSTDVRGTGEDGEPTYCGTGTPCYDCDDVRRAIEEAVDFCKAPKKDYEQLTLW